MIGRGHAPYALPAALLAWCLALEAYAASGAAGAFAAEARSNIDAVLAAEEFGHTEKVTRLRARKAEPDEERRGWLAALGRFWGGVAKLLAGLGEGVLWASAILTVLAIIYYRERWLPYLGSLRRRRVKARLDPAVRIQMADPAMAENIPAAALDLWRGGHPTEALALLYRGALARLQARFDLGLPAGATEGEVLRAIARAAPQAFDYFAALTRAWMSLAYAGRPPETLAAEIEPLAQGFRRHLEERDRAP